MLPARDTCTCRSHRACVLGSDGAQQNQTTNQTMRVLVPAGISDALANLTSVYALTTGINIEFPRIASIGSYTQVCLTTHMQAAQGHHAMAARPRPASQTDKGAVLRPTLPLGAQARAQSIGNPSRRNVTHEVWMVTPSAMGDGLASDAFMDITNLLPYGECWTPKRGAQDNHQSWLPPRWLWGRAAPATGHALTPQLPLTPCLARPVHRRRQQASVAGAAPSSAPSRPPLRVQGKPRLAFHMGGSYALGNGQAARVGALTLHCASCRRGPQVVAVPISAYTHSLYYRMDTFAKNNWTVPRTWRELAALALRINGTDNMWGFSGWWGPCGQLATNLIRCAGRGVQTAPAHSLADRAAVRGRGARRGAQ